ncbi:nitrate reductase [Terrihabitans soli]|uniref:Nitrate reductase n=1 Tax=Terrihabitans soli TaxID=708113 RepID=A0A6S6QT47_9HYPH|nr:nitrate reductase [Terrihabitans soli]BCJ92269.1 nitrate reductase [Terrihabitans soli]
MTALPATEPVRTTCPYCGTGCGVLGGPSPATKGDSAHPTNFGRVCAKGSALGETLGLENRLLHPIVNGERASMSDALDLVARRFYETIETHGPDSVAFYVSGQLLTEDYYVANKLMKGFIGSGNIDTNSRLCMASSVAGHKRAFGEDVVPCCYEDLDEADLVVLTGSNAAWCHPILFRRITDARQSRGTKIVTIDPRRTATAADADLFLPVNPGTDVLLFNGLFSYLARTGAVDLDYIGRSTSGFAQALERAGLDAPDIDAVAEICGVPRDDIEAFYTLFAKTQRVVTVYSQGVNQSSRGTDKVNAIINCHLATGRIGRPGMGPFSFTGQPNAMGGREVGGLANQLAAHMNFEEADLDRVRRFWNAPRLAAKAGLKAVDMFDALLEGRIKAMWVMGTNPAASLPDGNRVREALKKCEFLVVSDCVADTDTAKHADVLLPAAGWGEKDGTVTNSERRISRQRAFMPLPGETLPDWKFVAEIAQRMGFADAFDYRRPADIFREHAALSGFENRGARVFDISGLAEISDAEFESLHPVQWPVTGERRHGKQRLFGDGKYPAPDGRACFIAVAHHGPVNAADPDFPLVLNTGRLRDQWHTMTRTGEVAKLMMQAPEPVLEISAADAAAFAIADAGLAEVTSSWGRAIARVRISSAQRPGQIFLPMHWTDAMSAFGSPGRAVNPACDAVSGQPELKHTPARVRPFAVRWEGLLLSQHRFRPQGFLHWTRSKVEGGYLYRIAGDEPLGEGNLLGLSLLRERERPLDYHDKKRGLFRAAELDAKGAMAECLLVGAPGSLPDPAWLLDLFARGEPVSENDRRILLGARAAEPKADEGRVVCSCFAVGETRIRTAIADGARDTAALGRALKCGTNCGSCLPELRDLISSAASIVPAEPDLTGA